MKARVKQRRPRGARDVGREKLLDAARTLFRTKIKYEISRQEIARLGNATPALMTYYFETKADLVLAVTLPVMTKGITDLFLVIDSPEPFEVRFRKIVVELIDFAHQNASLLDMFIEAALDRGDEEARDLIKSCLHKLGSFFGKAIEAGVIVRSTNPTFVLLALWGTCRSVGERAPYPIQLFDTDMPLGDITTAQANLILDLFLHGTAVRPTA